MVEENVLVVVPVPVLLQNRRYLLLAVGVVERLGMGYVGIIGNPPVLGDLLVVQR